MRRIGQAKAGLAADYAAQLARSVGKVVFFAKHIDVMDVAEQTFAKRGIGYSSIRGDQTPKVRKANIEAFLTDPDVADRGLLADRCRCRAQPAGRLQRRARRAVVDLGRADPGDRPGPPHRPGRAGHGLADHRRPDHRPQDRPADRRQGRPRRPRPRRLRRGGRVLGRRAARSPGGAAHRGAVGGRGALPAAEPSGWSAVRLVSPVRAATAAASSWAGGGQRVARAARVPWPTSNCAPPTDVDGEARVWRRAGRRRCRGRPARRWRWGRR